MDEEKRSNTNCSLNTLYTMSDTPVTFTANRRTGLERCLLVFVVLFFLSTAAFAGLFAYLFLTNPDVLALPISGGATLTDHVVQGHQDGNVCNTPDCVETASMILKKMNMSASPCDDFYEFACGRFIQEEVTPVGRSAINTVLVLHEANQRVIKTILEEEPLPGAPRYLTLLQDLYTSCIDEDAIEAVGLDPYLQGDFAKDWPTLNPAWDSSTFDLNPALLRYAREFISPFVSYQVANDFMDSNAEIIYVGEPSLMLPQEYYSRERNDSVIIAVESYYRSVAIELGADAVTAQQDAVDLIDFEREVSKIMTPKEMLRNRARLYNPTTLKDLGETYTTINIRAIIETGFSRANISLDPTMKLINPTPTFMAAMMDVVNGTGARVLQNVLGFSYARNYVMDLTRNMRDIRFELDKVVAGKKERPPRDKACSEWTANVFGEGMSKEFVKRKFSENSKALVDEMIDDLQAEFTTMLSEADWMTDGTRQRALHKLSLMARRIGYPDVKFTDEDINTKFENYTISRFMFFENIIEIKNERNVKTLRKITKKANKEDWPLFPHQVNAFYDFTMNGITFLAAILQPPFFSYKFPRSVNYGGIGSIIGHEITHGFDDTGSQYNDKGNVEMWWAPEDMQRFVERRACVVDQYSGYRVPEVGMNINGVHTQGENIADIGGLKESFRAYKAATQRLGHELPLPGLGLSPEQTFFLAYAQTNCERSNKQRLMAMVATKKHPPGKYRVLGPLHNSKDFSQVFQCPVGSPMNPEVKCNVW